MRVEWNYIRCIHRSRSFMDIDKLGMVACLYNYEVACCDEDVVVLLYEGLMV